MFLNTAENKPTSWFYDVSSAILDSITTLRTNPAKKSNIFNMIFSQDRYL